MNLIHNRINDLILNMENIVAKGVPFAKRNKDRRIRATLKDMRIVQSKPPLFKDFWFYFKQRLKFILSKFHRSSTCEFCGKPSNGHSLCASCSEHLTKQR